MDKDDIETEEIRVVLFENRLTGEKSPERAIYDAGYRLDPYPNGKTKDELIKRIEELEAERDKARVLLYNVRNLNQVPGSVAKEIDGFLTKTSLVHG